MAELPPDDFTCPITRMVMDDPVFSLHTGLSYEKAAITKWLASGKNYCPVTGKPLSIEALKPNESLSWKIKYWKMKHGVEDTETSIDEIEEDVKLLPEARFVCPLTGKVMVDPVMTRHGNSFERSAIMKWIHMRGEVCPVTGEPLTQPYVVSNSRLAWEIKQWLLSVSEYADDIEYDAEKNIVHATAGGGGGGGEGGGITRDLNPEIVLSGSMKALNFNPNEDGGGGGGGGDGEKKLKKKKSSKKKAATGAMGVLASPVPQNSRSKQTVAAHGVPSSAPAGGVASKGRFKLKSPLKTPLFMKNMLGGRGNVPPSIDILGDDDEKEQAPPVAESEKPAEQPPVATGSEVEAEA